MNLIDKLEDMMPVDCGLCGEIVDLSDCWECDECGRLVCRACIVMDGGFERLCSSCCEVKGSA